MERLSEKEWKQFGFAEVFDIKKGFYNKKPEDDGTGTIPFLGATDSNNGVTRFLTLEEIKHGTKTGDLHNSPLEKKLFPGHAIAVTNNGSVGHAFYQATKFTCSHDINPLYLRDHEMSREEADFLIKAIEEQGILFQYARKWRPIRMVKSKIMLPIDDKGDPDYAYMTLYSTEVGGVCSCGIRISSLASSPSWSTRIFRLLARRNGENSLLVTYLRSVVQRQETKTITISVLYRS